MSSLGSDPSIDPEILGEPTVPEGRGTRLEAGVAWVGGVVAKLILPSPSSLQSQPDLAVSG